MSTPKQVGQWEKPFNLKNVCIHASLLPTGKVLYWGRRSDCQSKVLETMNEQQTLAFLWDPSIADRNSASKATSSQPLANNGSQPNTKINLFCSGHCFQPDGKLLVVGGHVTDGNGLDQTCLYDSEKDSWIPQTPMKSTRWYPSVLTLPDGNALAMGGNKGASVEHTLKSSSEKTWEKIAPSPINIDSPPRIYLDPKGQVFMAGPQAKPAFLRSNNTWEETDPARPEATKEFAASVLYDIGKVLYTGGGTDPPTDVTSIIDLTVGKPEWTQAKSLGTPRQQANATLLPDGTVLVTGGTRGRGFNNVGSDGQNPLPVHVPELWDPQTNVWTPMAAEQVDRCYHSIALLLPDGTVLSAGGGEWVPEGISPRAPNAGKDSLISAQIFTPPYLFDDKGKLAARPTITLVKKVFDYGETFNITIGANDKIKRVSWIKLGSITHCTNFNQAVVFDKDPKQNGNTVSTTAPVNPNVAPPGHYMLFVLNKNNVPALAPIVRINVQSTNTKLPTATIAARRAVEPHSELSTKALDEKIISEQERPPVVVGLKAACPYGLGPCWGGAFAGLQNISDIKVVRPLPNHDDSVAFVYTKQDIIPDIDKWQREFHEINANTHDMRGIEMTLSGAVSEKDFGTGKQLTLAGTSTRLELMLEPFQAASKIEWDQLATAPKMSSDAEIGAYSRLPNAVAEHPGAAMQVTGRLQKHGTDEYSLEVRKFEVVNGEAT